MSCFVLCGELFKYQEGLEPATKKKSVLKQCITSCIANQHLDTNLNKGFPKLPKLSTAMRRHLGTCNYLTLQAVKTVKNVEMSVESFLSISYTQQNQNQYSHSSFSCLTFTESQNQPIWKGPQSNLPPQARSSQSTQDKILSRWFLNISSERHSTISLGSLFQCVVTHTVRKIFCMFKWNSFMFS